MPDVKNLTVEYVNSASGLELHQFKWLNDDSEIGGIEEFGWNFLVDVQEFPENQSQRDQIDYCTGLLVALGLIKKSSFSYFDQKWFNARNDSMKIYNIMFVVVAIPARLDSSRLPQQIVG